MKGLQEKLEQCLRAHLRHLEPDQKLDPEASLRDLGLDSMSAIDLLLDLEKTFDVTFPDELIDAETFSTAASLRRGVESLRREAKGGAGG